MYSQKFLRGANGGVSQKAYSFLIVDDDPSIRIYIKHCLLNRFKDARIIEVENGKEAYRLLQSIKPSVLITDIDMPVMDGYDLISKVNKFSNWDVPVLIVSGKTIHDSSVNKNIKKFKRWSALKKPFSQEVLINHVQKLIETKS